MSRLNILVVAFCIASSATFALSAHAQSERSSRGLEVPEGQEKNVPPGVEELPPPSAGELLAERKRALDAREAELEQVEKDLAEIEKRIDSKMKRLEALIAKREKVEKGIVNAKKAEQQKRVARLVEVTGKMPPENAAVYLDEMSVDTASKIISGMKSRKAAAILAAMVPSKAAAISRKYLKSGKPKRTPQPKPGDKGQPEGAGQSPQP